ncbi:MAG: glycoside hydrolase family 36 protein [Chloroflexota bacterium]
MTERLASEALTFRLDARAGAWRLQPMQPSAPSLASAAPLIHWRQQGRRRWAFPLDRAKQDGPQDIQTQHGLCRSLSLIASGPDGIQARLTWQLGLEVPVLLWRAEVTNLSAAPVEMERIDLCHGRITWERDSPRGANLDPAFFTNGWQSWSYAGALTASDAFPRTRLGPLSRPMRVNRGTPQPRGRGRFSSDMFGVVGCRAHRSGLLVGFLSQAQAFGSLEADLRARPPRLNVWANGDDLRLDPGASFATDWSAAFPLDLDADQPLDPYLRAVERENGARHAIATPVGWCSWYYFFTHVGEANVLANLEWARAHREELPLELIQVDDGFQADVGDWDQCRASFPSGMAALAGRIREAGFRPGLWLAPFILKPTASPVRDHPDWILRGPSGRPVNAGYVWETFTRALDVTHPRALDWARGVIRTAVREWGYDYLKLDFLYAGALSGRRHDTSVTRAQALRRALEALRREAGEEVTLVGCGCPLGSGVGIFDAMRIGPDVADRWHPAYRGIEAFFRHEPDFPSARNAVRNTISRAALHRRWWVNDPDCLLLREPSPRPKNMRSREAHGFLDEDQAPPPTPISAGGLTEGEVQALATAIALSAGSLIVSEHLPSLSRERLSWLARLIPPLPSAARVVDWIDARSPSLLVLPLEGPVGAWYLVAVINWADSPKDLSVPLAWLGLPPADAYHALDFWQEAYRRLPAPALDCTSVPAHGARLMAMRPVRPGAEWIGDTLHVSQGLSVGEWRAGQSGIHALIDLGRRGFGRVWLALPAQPRCAVFEGRALTPHRVADDVYTLDLAVLFRGELEVAWD